MRQLETQRSSSHARARTTAALAGALLTVLFIPGLAPGGEVLGAGDTIHIAVFQNPDLTSERRISERGTVVFPLIGEIKLAGQTPVDAGARIAARLKEGKFLVNPQVNVSVVQVRSRQVSVLGHVARPGRYALEDPNARLTDVLALAGGVTESGDNTVIAMVTRDGQPSTLKIDVPAMYRTGDMSPNIEMQGGDTIYVPGAAVFYIYGEVQRAGSYRLEPESTVMNAISLGGGLTPSGTDRGVQIRRRTPDGQVRTLNVKLSDRVEPNDVIYVKESWF